MDSRRIQPVFALIMFLLLGVTQSSAMAEQRAQLAADQRLFEEAVALSEQQNWDQAEPIYRELMDRHEDWPEPRNNLAVLLFNTDRIDEARMMLEQAVISQSSFRISQHNRTQLYNYLASRAYNSALGEKGTGVRPEMKLIKKVELPVQVVEKRVEVVVEKRPLETQLASLEVTSDITAGDQLETQSLIATQLAGWADAWSQGDVDNYLVHYSQDFRPDDGRKSFQEWKNIRKARLRFSKSVRVSLDKIRLFLEPDGQHALVEFEQSYHSKSYSDRVLKQLYMQRGPQGDGSQKWLILAERVIKTY